MTGSDAEALLPTIVSRCEIIRLRPLSLTQVSEGLQERWDLPADEANLLAHLSGGRPGYALRLSENPDLLKQRQNQFEEHQKMLRASRVERFALAEELAKDRTRLLDTLSNWLTLWRDLMLKTSGAAVPLTNIDRADEINQLAAFIDPETAKNTVKNLERAIEQIEHYLNTRLVVEVLMLDLPRIP
jgi:DNA polymerase-3 subunit delta'